MLKAWPWLSDWMCCQFENHISMCQSGSNQGIKRLKYFCLLIMSCASQFASCEILTSEDVPVRMLTRVRVRPRLENKRLM